MHRLIHFSGFPGIRLGVIVFAVAWLLMWMWLWPKSDYTWARKLFVNHNFNFEPDGETGAFEKLLANYLDVSKTMIGLASGSIVLLVGSASFRSAGRLPASYASPLCLLALSVLCAIFFMVFEMMNYEDYRHKTRPYTRFKYSRNLGLACGGLMCFSFGYMWLMFVVTA